MNYWEKLFHACAITWGIGFLLGFSGIAQADDYRHKTTTEFNVNGTGYYGRLALTGDFNNDGRDEMLYLRMSPTYMDYQWSDKAKRRNVAYAQKGIAMAKADPDKWSAEFVTYTMQSSGKRGASWNVSFNGNSRLAPVGCIQPSQVVPTNFNSDAYTDFLIVCHGYDDKPWPGERSVVAVSDGPNNYIVKPFSKVGFYHDGDVADFNGDGNMDILLFNQGKSSKKAEVYLNDGNGNFMQTKKYFSQFATFKGAYGTEVIDINGDGRFDVGVFGHENRESWKPHQTMILINNGSNTFTKNNKVVVPAINGWGTVMDMFVEGENLFVLRSSSPKRYRGMLVQQVNIRTMKTVATLQNKNMQWYARIFRKQGGTFGSLMNTSNNLDFKLVGGVIKPAR
jgi:hypothetical protein